MPGIVGFVTKMRPEDAEAQLSRMVEAIRHERFYSTGLWMDEALGVYVGWTALKGSSSEGMPLSNEKGDISLVFAGEEYPEPGTASRLSGRGHSLSEEGLEYLPHLYEEDPNFLVRLNGLFHGLLIDRTQGRTFLFNDRYGMRRVYYHESKETFYFGSEAKAILAVRPELREADPKGLGEFIASSCVLENRTIFKHIRALPSASVWTFRNGAVEQKKTYFEPREWEEQSQLDTDEFYRAMRESFSGNLGRYFEGTERIGVALTGGLDTRAIMAWRKPLPGSLPCYTFGGKLRESQDVRVARQVANVCQQSHEIITVGNEFLSRFPHYAERAIYLSEGGIDVSRCSDLYVSEKARRIAPVKVVGTYGSEIIRHLVTFKAVMPKPGLYSNDFANWIEEARHTYKRIRNLHPVTFTAFRQSPWHHYGILGLEQSQLTVRSPYLDNDFVKVAYRAPNVNGSNGDLRLRLIHDGNPALSRIATDVGVGGDRGFFAAAASRSFLDFTLKTEYAYDYGMPQWVAKVDHFLGLLKLERLFLGRHKLLHYRTWYRDSLSEYVRQTLLDSKSLTRPYIDRKGVESIVRGHTRGEQNYTTEIHKLLTLELLHRLFLEPR